MNIRQNVLPSPQSTNGDDFELITSPLKEQAFIASYINYLASLDAKYNKSNLVGVFWKKDDKNFLSFRYKYGGSVISKEGSVGYLQYKLAHLPKSSPAPTIPYCLEQNQNVCIRCQFGYYLNGGKCFEVPLSCNEFNYKTNQCESCYQGYYLDSSNVCQEANFLCMSSDKRGNCNSCYKDYRMTSYKRCVYNAEGKDYNLP